MGRSLSNNITISTTFPSKHKWWKLFEKRCLSEYQILMHSALSLKLKLQNYIEQLIKPMLI